MSKNKQVDKSKSNYNSILHLINKYSRHTDEDNDNNSKDSKIIDTKLLTNISRDKDLRQDIDKQLRGVFHLRFSTWLENCTFFLQVTLPGTNSEVKCSS